MKESDDNEEKLDKSFNEDLKKKDILEKQEIIKKAIIDKNYDRNLFFSFCMSRKSSGADDLSNWSKEELNIAINDFIKEQDLKKSQEFKEIEEFNQRKMMAQNIQLNLQQFNPSQIPYQSHPQIQYNKSNMNEQIEIICGILPKTIFNDKEIKVEIKNPKPIETGFFTSNYIVYEIETSIEKDNTKWLVQRRYNDFLWLRDMLKKFYPYEFIPPLPGKKMGGRRFEMDFINKRMHFLNEFLVNIVKNEEFKASECLVSFLSLQENYLFEAKKKELNIFPPITNLGGYKNLTGKIKINYPNNNNENYFTNINGYFKLQVLLLERLNEHFKELNKANEQTILSLENINKDFELLHLLNKQVKMREDIIKTYEEFRCFFSDWKKITFNQNDIIKKHIKYFFNYYRMENNALMETFEKRNEIKAKFDKENNKLMEKKEKLWNQKDISKWEMTNSIGVDYALLYTNKNYAFSLMCNNDNFMINNLGNELGYANKKSIEELKIFVTKYQDEFVNTLKAFSDSLSQILSDEFNIWTKMASAIKT